jgi:hypothetical protein
MKYTLVLATIAGAALVTSANAQNIVEYGSMPSGSVLVSQLSDLGPGAQDNNRDYANNTGPAGQTFQVATTGTAYSVVVKARGDGASGWTTGPLPFDGTEQWQLQIGSVNGGGAITPIDTENFTGFVAGANITDYLTFNLANPVPMITGVNYEYTISVDNAAHTGAPWMGWAHSTGDALASGYAMNNDTSMVNGSAGFYGGDGGTTPVMGGFAAPNPVSYDYAFAILQVPEPTTVALLGLGGLALVAFRRRA